MPKKRIAKGRTKLAENRALLDEVSAKFGVQARFIVAFWGIETDFGRITGGFPVIASLATLAHDGRRSAFFRKQLLYALKIIDQGHITPAKMVGSWAGAMGQCQFMPSSFVNFAQDHDGDGRRDIWGTRADVFASAANYLKKSGWRGDQTWGRKVRLPDDFSLDLADGKTRKQISEWRELGVRNMAGGELPSQNLKAAIVLPEDGRRTPAYMVYGNYEAILKWNRSHYFAIAVGTLSDAIQKGQ